MCQFRGYTSDGQPIPRKMSTHIHNRLRVIEPLKKFVNEHSKKRKNKRHSLNPNGARSYNQITTHKPEIKKGLSFLDR